MRTGTYWEPLCTIPILVSNILPSRVDERAVAASGPPGLFSGLAFASQWLHDSRQSLGCQRDPGLSTPKGHLPSQSLCDLFPCHTPPGEVGLEMQLMEPGMGRKKRSQGWDLQTSVPIPNLWNLSVNELKFHCSTPVRPALLLPPDPAPCF